MINFNTHFYKAYNPNTQSSKTTFGSSSINWPKVDPAKLRITQEQYMNLRAFLEAGIDLIKEEKYQEALLLFTDEKEAAQTGIKLVVDSYEFQDPPRSLREAGFMERVVEPGHNDSVTLDVVIGKVTFKNSPTTLTQQESQRALYHSKAFTALHEWLHALQNSTQSLLSQELGTITIDYFERHALVDQTNSRYRKPLNGITSDMVKEADTWIFLSENGIPLPEFILEHSIKSGNNGYFLDNPDQILWTEAPLLPEIDLFDNSNITAEIAKMKPEEKRTIGRRGDIVAFIHKHNNIIEPILDKHAAIEKLPNGNYLLEPLDPGARVSLHNNGEWIKIDGSHLTIPYGKKAEAPSGYTVKFGTFTKFKLP